MSKSVSIFILAFSIAGSASANPMVSNIPSDPVIIQSPFPAGFSDGPQYTPREWLAKLRRQCKSDNRYDQQRCTEGLAFLRKGHQELLYRRAAAATATD
jgi:hypothetical protein